LRGFRIELGEIETLLAAQPEVQSAAVLVREDTPGDQRLVAYCLPRDGTLGEQGEWSRALRERLKATLPAFMVPATIVWLERWPMNANGKLDRKALPAPDASDAPAASTPYRKPETAVEEIVAGVWGEVLGLAQVGTEHDFFDVGGHSLLAMQAASRISRLFGRRVTLRSFFQHSTIRSFAAALVAEETTPGRTDAVARALIKLRDMTPEERERRRAAAAASASQKNPGTRDGHE
ncbi:MAG: hypothetical protein JO180_00225, partial [Gemmatirosa sp.]|nr:hypothetical protein [Gemmatirosa sp.]